MFIHEKGTGSALVLLHGAPGTVESFAPVVERFSPRFRVLVPALPGYRPTPPLQPYSLAGVQHALEDALLERGVREAAVVAFSAGVYRALALALSGRVRVTRLVLLGGFAGLSPEDRAAYRGFSDWVGGMADLTGAELREVACGRFLSPAYRAAHPEAEAEVRAWLEATAPAPFSDELRALAESEDLHPRLSEVQVPVVARVGTLDVAAPPAYSERLVAGVPHGRLERVEGAGHALLLEDREGTLASLARALEPPADR
jgi:pimeloyl-ACP methyl ester carboxylesterase